MPWWTWAALGFFAAVLLAATVVVAVLAAKTLGELRRTRETATAALEGLAQATETLERRLATATERSAEVERRIDRLNRSLEQLSVLRWALRDARTAVGRVRGAVPRK